MFKACCKDPKNHKVYGKGGRSEVFYSKAGVNILYAFGTYIKCKVCKKKLYANVIKVVREAA